MNFANNLVSIRESQHISRRQFADALGVTTAAIANWETGKREPNLTTLRAIANYFMVTPDDLLADMPSNDNSWILQMQNLLKKQVSVLITSIPKLVHYTMLAPQCLI